MEKVWYHNIQRTPCLHSATIKWHQEIKPLIYIYIHICSHRHTISQNLYKWLKLKSTDSEKITAWNNTKFPSLQAISPLSWSGCIQPFCRLIKRQHHGWYAGELYKTTELFPSILIYIYIYMNTFLFRKSFLYTINKLVTMQLKHLVESNNNSLNADS